MACFLEEVGLGGCLVDDMGPGATVQVWALLEGRLPDPPARGGAPGAEGLSSLIVAPRPLARVGVDGARRSGLSARAEHRRMMRWWGRAGLNIELG